MIYDGGLGPYGISLTSKGWRLKSVICVVSHADMTDPPTKTLDTKAGVSFPGSDNLGTLPHITAGRSKHCSMAPLGEDRWKITPGHSWTLPNTSLPFAVIRHNGEYNHFSEFCESF